MGGRWKLTRRARARTQSSEILAQLAQVFDKFSDEEKKRREDEWKKSDLGKLNVKRGVLLRYARDVASASEGAYCD